MPRRRGRPLGHTRPPAGTGPGLGGRSSSGRPGQIRKGSLGSRREGKGGGGAGWPASPRGLSLSSQAQNQSPAQPSCRACRLLSLPRTNRPQVWGAHILSPNAQDTACGPHLPAPRQHLHSSLEHRCLFTQMGEQGRGRGGALLRETSLSETLPPRGHFPQRRGRSKVQPGSAGWGR